MPTHRSAATPRTTRSRTTAGTPTLQQVAERAGVSRSTAASVLGGRAARCRISDACAARVRDAATALGYRGNYHARTLSTGRSQTIGLTMGGGETSTFAHGFWGAVAGGVEAAARQRGYDVLLVGERGDDALAEATQRLDSGRIDALIVLRRLFWRFPAALLRRYRTVVTIDGADVDSAHDVGLDAAPGIAEAVDHLAALGHRSLLWIGVERDGAVILPERRAAFRAASRRRRLAVRELLLPERAHGGLRPDEHIVRYQAALAAAELPGEATAALCYNDFVAVALQALLTARGASLPRDLSVIGFDDLMATVATPPLTTISHRLDSLGATAVSVALALLDDDATRPPATTLVPARLVIRGSTGAAPPRR